MQFQYEHKVGDDHVTVILFGKAKSSTAFALADHFERIGGTCEKTFDCWKFPNYITSKTIGEIIRNTCFECGGMVKDSDTFYKKDGVFLPIRKCKECNHSHV